MRSGVELIDRSLLETADWLTAVGEAMNVKQPRLALTSLQATLQALRDQLPPEPAARLADHLPLPLKGAFFEGWRPGAALAPARNREEFLARIEAVMFRPVIAVERAAKAALEVIGRMVPAGDMAEVVGALPEDVRSLWPHGPAPLPDRRASPAALH